MRAYRPFLAGRITAFATSPAIALSDAIATWAVVKAYPLL